MTADALRLCGNDRWGGLLALKSRLYLMRRERARFPLHGLTLDGEALDFLGVQVGRLKGRLNHLPLEPGRPRHVLL